MDRLSQLIGSNESTHPIFPINSSKQGSGKDTKNNLTKHETTKYFAKKMQNAGTGGGLIEHSFFSLHNRSINRACPINQLSRAD